MNKTSQRNNNNSSCHNTITPSPSFIQWNCRGFWPRKPEIDLLVSSLNPVALCLQETHLKLNRQDINYPTLNGYTAYHSNESDNPSMSGGVSIFVQNGWKCEQIYLNTHLEAIAVKVHWHFTLTLVSVYIKPGVFIPKDQFKNFIDEIPSPYILMGDFNASNTLWGSSKTDNRGHMIEEVTLDENTIILNDGSNTNLSLAHGTFNSVDLTLTVPYLGPRFLWEVAHDLHGSDHYPIFLTDLDTVNSFYPNGKKWIENSADWPLFASLMNQNVYLSSPSIIEDYKDFIDNILLSANESIPTNKVCNGKRRVPWWNNEIKNLLRDRKRALRKFKKHPSAANKDNYLNLLTQVKDTINQAKLESWRQFTRSISVHTTSKEMWDKIKSIRGFHHQPIKRVDLPTGSSTNPQEMSNLLVKKFSSTSSNESLNPSEILYKQQIKDSISDPLTLYTCVSPINQEFSFQELQRALSRSSGKSCGPNSVSYGMIKNLPLNSLYHLLSLFNRMWKSEVFPLEWKSSILIPIPKKNPINTDYRPIALSNCDLKIFERMINFRLIWFLEEGNLLSRNQVGFRPGRSTINAIVNLCGDILESFTKGSHTTAVFFDLEKAYDRVWDVVIIKQLRDWGIEGHILAFIKFYLDIRSVRVRIGNFLSSEEFIENGVPQGGVLSVTLFLVAINGIFSLIPPNDSCKILVYADDIVIYNTTQDNSLQCIEIQKTLNKVGNWATKNGFKFSVNKTKIMHFCRKHRCQKTMFSLNGSVLEYTEIYKYLGMWLDPKLTFKRHIKETKTACTARLNVIKCLAGLTWGSNRDSLLAIHESTVLAKMFYGCEVYASAACKTTLNSLNSVYNSGYRLSTGAFRTSPVNGILAEAGVPPLDIRWETIQMSSAIRMMANTNVPGHQDINNYEEKFSPKNFFNIVGPKINHFLEGLSVQNAVPMPSPPWQLEQNSTNVCISSYAYKDMSTDELVDLFTHVCENINPNNLVLYCDGSAQENNKGFAIISDYDTLYRAKCHESLLVFELEARAIKNALLIAKELSQEASHFHKHYIIASDSLSVITAVQNIANTSPIVTEIRNILIEMTDSTTLLWVPGHRGIPGNERADIEAKAASQLPSITDTNIPLKSALILCKKYTDTHKHKWFKLEVSGFIKKTIPSLIRPKIPDTLTRKESTILARLRIGHTRLTKSYLLSRSPQPLCPSCKKPLTVEHILSECKNLELFRKQVFGNSNPIKMLDFSEVNTNKILQFLKILDLIDEI